jgi:hypothetical protein
MFDDLRDEALSRWRKSSYSGSNGGNCVEVRDGPGVILVRDTADRNGPALAIDPAAWRRFTDQLRSDAR